MLTVGQNSDDGTGRTLVAADFTSINAALASIPSGLFIGGECSAHYLVKVLPGIYNEQVTMLPCVDIEGSGEQTTQIMASSGHIFYSR